MDQQKILESLAREKGVPLTTLAEVSSRFSQSGKVACCGGAMARLVTESAADSTVLLRDGSGSCYCALHGDVTNRYPDVLTTGALLLFTDVTVLVLSSKVPPLLVACLQNLAGLLLPDEASTAAAAAVVTDTGDSMAGPAAAAGFDSAVSDTRFFHASNTRETETTGEPVAASPRHGFAGPENESRQYPVLGEKSLERHAGVAGNGGSTSGELPQRSGEGDPLESGGDPHPAAKRMRAENSTTAPETDHANEDDDDDAECLELVDDL